MRKTFGLFMTIVVLITALPMHLTADADFTADQIKNCVIPVLSVCYVDDELFDYRAGSGVFVGEENALAKTILTSSYVLKGSSAWPENSVVLICIMGEDGLELVDDRNIRTLSEDDSLTLLTLPEKMDAYRNIVFETSRDVVDGETIHSAGFIEGSFETVTGEVYDLFEYGGMVDFFNTTAQVDIEQWGGPVFSEDGRAVGLCIGAGRDEGKDSVHSINVGSKWIYQLLQNEGVYNKEATQNRDGYLLGAWGESVSTRASAVTEQQAFYLNTPIDSCTGLTVEFEITDYTGQPFDLWYLDVRDLNGNWIHAGSFKVDESTVNHMKAFTVTFDKSISFDAITVVSSSKWNTYSLHSNVSFRNAITN